MNKIHKDKKKPTTIERYISTLQNPTCKTRKIKVHKQIVIKPKGPELYIMISAVRIIRSLAP